MGLLGYSGKRYLWPGDRDPNFSFSKHTGATGGFRLDAIKHMDNHFIRDFVCHHDARQVCMAEDFWSCDMSEIP